VPNFVSVASPRIAELTSGEKSHSLTHSLSLFDLPGNEAFASEQPENDNRYPNMFSMLEKSTLCTKNTSTFLFFK